MEECRRLSEEAERMGDSWVDRCGEADEAEIDAIQVEAWADGVCTAAAIAPTPVSVAACAAAQKIAAAKRETAENKREAAKDAFDDYMDGNIETVECVCSYLEE